jgi:hypothetical protein
VNSETTHQISLLEVGLVVFVVLVAIGGLIEG